MEPSGLVIVTPVLVSVISCPCLVKSSAATRGLFMSLLLYTFAVSFKPLQLHDVVPIDFNFDPFGRIAVTVEDESQVFFTSDRGIDVLCAPQSSMGGAVGVCGKFGVAMQEGNAFGRGLYCWSSLILAIAWFTLRRRRFSLFSLFSLHVSSPSVHLRLELGLQGMK